MQAMLPEGVPFSQLEFTQNHAFSCACLSIVSDDSAEEGNSTSVLATLAALAEATAQNSNTSKHSVQTRLSYDFSHINWNTTATDVAMYYFYIIV